MRRYWARDWAVGSVNQCSPLFPREGHRARLPAAQPKLYIRIGPLLLWVKQSDGSTLSVRDSVLQGEDVVSGAEQLESQQHFKNICRTAKKRKEFFSRCVQGRPSCRSHHFYVIRWLTTFCGFLQSQMSCWQSNISRGSSWLCRSALGWISGGTLPCRWPQEFGEFMQN